MMAHGSELVANVRVAVPCGSVVRRIGRQHCRVSLDGIEGERLIVDVDELVPDGEVKCDYLFFSNRPAIAPIELKRGEVGASEAKRQLQAGADLAHELAEPKSLRCELKPVVFSGRIHRAERELLRRSQFAVRFRSATFEIKVAKCGSSLADVLR